MDKMIKKSVALENGYAVLTSNAFDKLRVCHCSSPNTFVQRNHLWMSDRDLFATGI